MSLNHAPINKKNPLCNNCKGAHRATSNKCPIRQKFLIIRRTHKGINSQNSLRRNPESSYFMEAPPLQPIPGLLIMITPHKITSKLHFSLLQTSPLHIIIILILTIPLHHTLLLSYLTKPL